MKTHNVQMLFYYLKIKVIVLEFKTGGNKVTLDYVAQFMDYQSILKTYC